MTTFNAIEYFNASKNVGIHSLLTFLIKSESDAIELDTEILSSASPMLTVALGRLQKKRLEANYMSKQQFLEMFDENPIQACEKLFQEEVIQWDIEYMKKKGKTAEYIYDRHVEQPYTRFLTFVA
jgi:hypothetical protein